MQRKILKEYTSKHTLVSTKEWLTTFTFSHPLGLMTGNIDVSRNCSSKHEDFLLISIPQMHWSVKTLLNLRFSVAKTRRRGRLKGTPLARLLSKGMNPSSLSFHILLKITFSSFKITLMAQCLVILWMVSPSQLLRPPSTCFCTT